MKPWATIPLLLLLPLWSQAAERVSPAPPPDDPPATIVTTHSDTADPTDGVISLREAILYLLATNTSETIRFNLSAGTPTTLQLTDTLPTIRNSSVSINGNNRGTAGGTVTILAPTGSKIITAFNSSITLDSLTLSGGTTGGPGGAILCYQTHLTLLNCRFLNNQSDYGGAIYCDSYPRNLSSAYIADCQFINNRSVDGGAIYLSNCDTSYILRTIFLNNTAHTLGTFHSHGGAINIDSTFCIMDSCRLAHSHSSIREEDWMYHAKSYGGALSVRNSQLQIANTTFDTNSTYDTRAGSDLGGALYSERSKVRLSNCAFNSDSCRGRGGAIYNIGDSPSYQLIITHTTFTHCHAYNGFGGALYHESTARCVIDNCTFHHNSTDIGGAILFQVGSGISTVSNSTFANNRSLLNGQGGAINIRGGNIHLVNNLFLNNISVTSPQDIYIRNGLTVKAYNNIWQSVTGTLTLSQGNTTLTATTPQQVAVGTDGLPIPVAFTVRGVRHTILPPLLGSLAATAGIHTAHSMDYSTTAHRVASQWYDDQSNAPFVLPLIPDSLDQTRALRSITAQSVGSVQCRPADTLHIAATACDSLSWRGRVLTASGHYYDTVPSTNLWDSIYHLNLTIHHGTHNTVNQAACEEYAWNGQAFSETGTYAYHYTNPDGCPSTDTLHLTINLGTHNTESQTACEEYNWHEQTYNATGSYTYNYINTDGCSSTDTLHLTINLGTHNTESQTACEEYYWHNNSYTTSGSYTYHYSNTDGCNSTDTLHLTIINGTHNTETQTVCELYTWHNLTYTTTGIYTYNYYNTDGCPSTDTLHLTIYHGTHNIETQTACEQYSWHEQTYTTTGNYTYSYINTDGCHSTDTLHLTISQHDNTSFEVSACEQYTWNGNTYSETGTYTYDHTQTGSPCTNVDTLHLTINHGSHNTETQIACEQFSWHEQLHANNTYGTETHTLKLEYTSMTTHRQVLPAPMWTLFTSQSTTEHTIQKPKVHASNTFGMNNPTTRLGYIPITTRTLTDAPALTLCTSLFPNTTMLLLKSPHVNNTLGTETRILKLEYTSTTTHKQVLPAPMWTLFTSQSITKLITRKPELNASNTHGTNRLTPLLVLIHTTTQTPTAAQAQILCTSLFPNMTIQRSRQLHASNTSGTETRILKLAPTLTTTHR